jgi:hypothetical protein
MRILLLTMNKADATSYYRAAGISKDLERQSGATIDCYDWTEITLTWVQLSKYDIIWMQRPVQREAVNAITYLKLMNKPVWIDWDDDLFNIPQTHTNYMVFAQNRDNIIAIAQSADVITVSTESIRDSYLPYNANIRVIPNAIQDELLKPFTSTRTNILFYRGMKSHEDDVYAYQRHFQKLQDEGYIMKFMGFNPARYIYKATFVGERDIYHYFKYLQDIRPLALMFPMIDSPFNRSRSNIAWLEATMAGSIVIAPNWPEWQHAGIIHCNPENFYAITKEVAKGNVDVERLYQSSYEYINENLRLSVVNKLRVQVINELMDRKP